jgi:hypothetical protein
MTVLKRIALALIAVVALLFLLVWILSPTVTRWFLGDTLTQYGLTLDPQSTVRLNPFSSVISISDASIADKQGVPFALHKLKLGYSLSRLVTKEVHIDYLVIEDLELDAEIQGDQMRIAGFDSNPNSDDPQQATKSDDSTSEPLSLAFSVPEIAIRGVQINLNYHGHLHVLGIQTLDITNSFYQNENAETALNGVLFIDGAKLSINASAALQQNNAKLEGQVELDALELNPFAHFAQGALDTLGGELSIDLDIDASYENNVLHLSKNTLVAELRDLDASAQGLRSQLDQLNLDVSDISGSFDSESGLSLSLGSKLNLDKATVKTSETHDTLLSIGKLSLAPADFGIENSVLHFTSPSLSVTELRASDIHADNPAAEVPALLSLSSIHLNNIELKDNKLNLSSVEFGEGSVSVLIDQAKQMTTLVSLDSDTTSDASEPAPDAPENTETTEPESDVAEADSSAFFFAVNSVVLNKPLSVHIQDASVSPKFEQRLSVTELSIGKIDSQDTQLFTPMSFALDDGKYFKSTFSAEAQVFSEHLNANFDLDVKEFSLPQINPYIADVLDMEFKTGQMDSKISGDIKEAQLDALAKINLRAADFSAAQAPADESNLIGQSAIPLNVALGMLKDKQGNIELKIPVDGDIEDPNFGMRYLLGLVAKKAAMKQAKNYLITTFVPYAQVVKVAMSAGSFALKVRFEDLPYREGQTAPETDQMTFVSQLKQLMIDKPALQVKICPVVTGEEFGVTKDSITPSIQEQAVALGQQRAEDFKVAVVASSEVESARLLVCQTKLEFGEKSMPRIKFSI